MCVCMYMHMYMYVCMCACMCLAVDVLLFALVGLYSVSLDRLAYALLFFSLSLPFRFLLCISSFPLPNHHVSAVFKLMDAQENLWASLPAILLCVSASSIENRRKKTEERAREGEREGERGGGAGV